MSTIVAENFITPSGTGLVPIGTVIMYYGAAAPSGYLECNGQSTTGYADLEALIGPNTPDLRGEFVRGWDNGKGTDTGRTLGSAQAGEIESHDHTMHGSGTVSGYYLSNSGLAQNYSGSGGASFGGSSSVNSSVRTGSAGGTETRPRNIALMYCIKH